METLITYFQMSGHAWFVWPAYGITLAVMMALVVNSLSTLRTDRKILTALESANPRRARPGQPPDSDASLEARSGEARDDT
jgi:heme exporter protein CcmD